MRIAAPRKKDRIAGLQRCVRSFLAGITPLGRGQSGRLDRARLTYRMVAVKTENDGDFCCAVRLPYIGVELGAVAHRDLDILLGNDAVFPFGGFPPTAEHCPFVRFECHSLPP